MLAGIRLRAGRAGSEGRGHDGPRGDSIARAAGATVSSWSAATPPTATARWSPRRSRGPVLLGADQEPSVNRAIGTIDENAWTPVHYPGEVTDPDTGELISDAEVAETEYTAFGTTGPSPPG